MRNSMLIWIATLMAQTVTAHAQPTSSANASASASEPPAGSPPAPEATAPAPAPATAPAPVGEQAQAAPSQEALAAASRDDNSRASIIISAKAGGLASFGGLAPFGIWGLDAGFILPVQQRRLAIMVAFDYTQPTQTGTEMDPRVASGSYTWHLTEQQVHIMPALYYRATQFGRVVPYGGIGPRIELLRSKVKGTSTPTITQTSESSTTVGVGLPVGAEFQIGPGCALAELLLTYGNLDHTATGLSNTGGAALSLGYRFVF